MTFKQSHYFFVFNIIIIFISNTACMPISKERLYFADDYAFVGNYTAGLEGPAVDDNGNLYFVNPYHNGAVGMVDTAGNFKMFVESLPNQSVANGIRFGRDKTMYLADYEGHNILSIDPSTKKVKLYAHDERMNQPNDIAIYMNDILFASDPNWADSTGQLWVILKEGKTMLLAKDMGTTNGIEISPNGKKLYVNESIQRNIWVFDINDDHNISNKRLLIAFDDYGLDGMRCDVDGNLYVARYGKGTIVKISPTGEILKEITLKGKKATNVAFGGQYGKTVFVTMQDRGYIEYFKVEAAGRAFVH